MLKKERKIPIPPPPPRFFYVCVCLGGGALYPTQQQQLCKTCKASKISCTRPGLVRCAEARQVQGARGPLQLGARAPQSARTHTYTHATKREEKRKENVKSD